MEAECSFDGCNKKIKFRTGLCGSHHAQQWRGEELRPLRWRRTEIDPPGMKTCSKCNVQKNHSEFHKDVAQWDGHKSQCKDCALEDSRTPEGRERSATRRNSDRGKLSRRRSALKKSNWTPEMFDLALDLQDGKCANPRCDNSATDADHDHETGDPRAPMCQPCNLSFGILKEDPELIRGLAEYAEQCINARMWVII